MSKFYPWTEREADIEHDGITLKVTMRRPESSDSDEDWEFRAIRVPSSCESDSPSINLVDWMLTNVSKAAMDEIEQAAKRAIIDEGVAEKEADDEEHYASFAESMLKTAFAAEARARAKVAERIRA